MPGKKTGPSLWTYLTELALLRSVSSADTVTQAGVEAITESIDMSQITGDTDNETVPIGVAAGNMLTLGVLLADGATATVNVYVKMKPAGVTNNYWALASTTDITNSTQIAVENVYPSDEVKVAIEALSAGTAQIVYSRTA